jgi:hypothetical protein
MNVFAHNPGENATCEYCTRALTRNAYGSLWSCHTKQFDRTCPYDVKKGRFEAARTKDPLAVLHESFRREPVAT